MRGYVLAVLTGFAGIVLLLGISYAVTDDTAAQGGAGTPQARQDARFDAAVALLAPTFAGGDCPAVDRPATQAQRNAASAIARAVTADPARLVPSPDGTGIEVTVEEVAGQVADEVESCIFAVDAPGAGWEGIVSRLRP